jgi:hypothetical protein
VHFHQAVLDNNLAEITVAYESGWNKYTEKFYSRTEWPEAEIIAPLVNDGTCVVVTCRAGFPSHRACRASFGGLVKFSGNNPALWLLRWHKSRRRSITHAFQIPFS